MKSFKEFLKEAKIYSVNPDGTRKLSKVEGVKFIHSQLQKSLDYTEVCNVSDTFHEVYKKSDSYISATGKKDKLANERIRDLMSKNQEMEYPSVDVCPQGNVTFKQGAHRYMMQGRLNMPKTVAMSKESYKNAKKNNYVT